MSVLNTTDIDAAMRVIVGTARSWHGKLVSTVPPVSGRIENPAKGLVLDLRCASTNRLCLPVATLCEPDGDRCLAVNKIQLAGFKYVTLATESHHGRWLHLLGKHTLAYEPDVARPDTYLTTKTIAMHDAARQVGEGLVLWMGKRLVCAGECGVDGRHRGGAVASPWHVSPR